MQKILAACGLVLVGVAASAMLRPDPVQGANPLVGRWQISRQEVDDGSAEKVYLLDTANGITFAWDRVGERWVFEPK